MTEADRDRIASLGYLCEAAAKSAYQLEARAGDRFDLAAARFHRESAEQFSSLAFKAASE